MQTIDNINNIKNTIITYPITGSYILLNIKQHKLNNKDVIWFSRNALLWKFTALLYGYHIHIIIKYIKFNPIIIYTPYWPNYFNNIFPINTIYNRT